MTPGLGLELGFGGLVPLGGNSGPALNTLFGVNMSGAEFSTPNFPSTADWAYLASKGVTFVRLPVAWENLLTTVGGATLAATYLANLKTAIAGAHAVGIGVIVDLHNFGAYTAAAQWGSTVTYAGNAGTPATGVSFLGNGITSANFANIWTLLATALVGTAGLIGYGLMNEPSPNIVGTQLLYSPNGFANTIGTFPWEAQNGGNPTALANGTNPLGASYGPAWSLGSGTGFGLMAQFLNFSAVPYTISVYAKSVSGGNPLGFNIAALGTPNFSLSGSFQRFAYSGAPSAGNASIQIVSEGGAGSVMDIANAQLELRGAQATVTISANAVNWSAHGLPAGQQVFLSTTGSFTGFNTNVAYFVVNPTTNAFQIAATAGGSALTISGTGTITGTAIAAYQPNNYLPFAQAAINAIRAVDATTPVYICGALGSVAYLWPWLNWELGTQLSGGNLIFEGHQYFGSAPGAGGGSTYGNTFTGYGQSVTGGVDMITPWINWLSTVGVNGYLGELGVPNSTADNNRGWFDPASKNTVIGNVFSALRTAKIPATMWNYDNSGSDPGHTDILDVAPQSGVDDPRLLQMLSS